MGTNTPNTAERQRSAGGPFLSYDDVCRRYGIVRSTLYRWVRAGQFPAPVRVGKQRVVFRLAEVEAHEASLQTVSYDPEAA